MSLENSPRYMRAMQKINRLGPEELALFRNVTADPAFASENIRKRLQSMITRTGRDSRERNFALRKEMAGSRRAMADRSQSYNKGQSSKALGLGIGNLALSAASGAAERKRTKEIMAILKERANRYSPVNYSEFTTR